MRIWFCLAVVSCLTLPLITQQSSASGRPEPVRVLTLHGEPSWEYRYLQEALVRRAGFSALCVTFAGLQGQQTPGHTPNLFGNFDGYDVVVVDKLALKQYEMVVPSLQRFVKEQGGSVIITPPADPAASRLLGDLLPTATESLSTEVRTEAPLQLATLKLTTLKLTTQGRQSPGLVSVWGSQAELREGPQVRPVSNDASNSVTLVTTADEASGAVVVERTLGKGRSLYLGLEDVWRWRQGNRESGDGPTLAANFWCELIRHMAR